MKTWVLLLLAVAAQPAWSQDEAGWWRMDEPSGTTAIDSSSAASDGTLANSPTRSTDVPPVKYTNPRSLSFNGGSQVVTLPTALYNGLTGTFTMSIWVKPTTTRNATTESNTGAPGVSSQRYAIFPSHGDATWGAGTSGAGLSIGTNGISVFEHAANHMPSTLVWNATVSSTAWTHVAVVYVNGTPTLYVNGVAVRTGVPSTKTVHPAGSIGGLANNGYGPYAGGIDDFRVFPRALSAADVASLADGYAHPGLLLTGVPPTAPTNLRQTGPLGTVAPGGWVGATVTFAADLHDPNPAQQVFLEVEVKATAASWTGRPTASTPLGAQGAVTIIFPVPASGGYDWRYRVGNANGDFYPNDGVRATWGDFDPGTPDFQSDQTAPSAVAPIYPVNETVMVNSTSGGNLTFLWGAATDNGPVVTYDVEVSTDAGSTNLLASLTGLTGTSASVYLSPSPLTRYWRVRARDISGTAGAWSATSTFKVVAFDPIDHGAGDAVKSCGMSVSGSSGIFALLIVAAALSRFSR